MTENLAWTVLLLPLAAAVIITLFSGRAKSASAIISIGAVLASFACSLVLFLGLREAASAEATPWNWLTVGLPGGDQLKIDIGLRLDALSLLMLLVVTGVGGLIHIYSYGYMHDDPGFSRFFACLSLFTFSMLGIVLANNFVMMFIFWELVGVSSYLLIGFWYEKPSAGDAAKKAFITNRLGDFGFLLGIIMLWSATNGLVNFDALQSPVHNGTQRVPHEPVVAEWLFFPHPVYRQGVLLRFAKKTPVTLNLPTLYPQATGQAAIHFPMRSGEEVSLGFTTRDGLPK